MLFDGTQQCIHSVLRVITALFVSLFDLELGFRIRISYCNYKYFIGK